MINELFLNPIKIPFICVSEPVVERILSFRTLKNGWMYGAGKPAPAKMIETALRIYQLLKNYGSETIEAFPIENGRIMLAGYHDNNSIEIWCEFSGNFDVIIEKDNETVKEFTAITFMELENELGFLSWNKKSSADLHIHNITVLKNNGTVVQHSKSREMEHLSYVKNVQLNIPNVPAYTFKSATRYALPEHQ